MRDKGMQTILDRCRQWLHGNWIALSVLFVLSSALCAKMFDEGLIFEAHDVWVHASWLRQVSDQVSQGVLYPRWMPGDNYGFGSPGLVFYPPAIYLIGAIFINCMHMSVDSALNCLVFFATFAAAFFSYILLRLRCASWVAAIASSLWIISPYFMFDRLIRCAVPELFGFALMPFVLFAMLAARRSQWWVPVPSLILAASIFCHPPTAFINLLLFVAFTPVLWAGSTSSTSSGAIRTASLSKKALWCLNPFVALGLASIYAIPYFSNISFVNLEAFARTFGDFSENLIGAPRWVALKFLPEITTDTVVAAVAASLFLAFCWRRMAKELKPWAVAASVSAVAAFLLMTPLAIPIWSVVPFMSSVFFPWRFLGLLSLSVAVLMGVLLENERMNRSRYGIVCGVLLAAVVVVFAFDDRRMMKFRSGLRKPGNFLYTEFGAPNRFGEVRYKVLGDIVDGKNKDRFPEQPYFFGAALPSPENYALKEHVATANGEAQIVETEWKDLRKEVTVTCKSPCRILIRQFAFPGWEARLNEKPVELPVNARPIAFDLLQPGLYKITLVYRPDDAMPLTITVLSLLVLAAQYACIAKASRGAAGS